MVREAGVGTLLHLVIIESPWRVCVDSHHLRVSDCSARERVSVDEHVVAFSSVVNVYLRAEECSPSLFQFLQIASGIVSVDLVVFKCVIDFAEHLVHMSGDFLAVLSECGSIVTICKEVAAFINHSLECLEVSRFSVSVGKIGVLLGRRLIDFGDFQLLIESTSIVVACPVAEHVGAVGVDFHRHDVASLGFESKREVFRNLSLIALLTTVGDMCVACVAGNFRSFLTEGEECESKLRTCGIWVFGVLVAESRHERQLSASSREVLTYHSSIHLIESVLRNDERDDAGIFVVGINLET